MAESSLGVGGVREEEIPLDEKLQETIVRGGPSGSPLGLKPEAVVGETILRGEVE